VDEKIYKEVDGEVYWILCGQEDSIRKHSRIGVSSRDEGIPSDKCEKDSEVLRAGKGTKKDPISSSRDRGVKGI